MLVLQSAARCCRSSVVPATAPPGCCACALLFKAAGSLPPLSRPSALPLPLQVLDMERELLRVLGFDLTQPTIKTFLRRYIKAASGKRWRLDPLFPSWSSACQAPEGVVVALQLSTFYPVSASSASFKSSPVVLPPSDPPHPHPPNCRRDPAGRDL